MRGQNSIKGDAKGSDRRADRKIDFLRSSESYWLFSIEDDGELSSPISKPDGHHLLEFL
jgi:hypothetical protein